MFAHGATGKGNDQCRFQLAAEALDPSITVLAPWRIASFRERFPGRKELIEFCEARNIPVKASKGKPYSSDENCLHTSYEAGLLEELSTDGFGLVEFGMTVSPQEAPDTPETVVIEFATGLPVAVAFDAGNLPHVARVLRQLQPVPDQPQPDLTLPITLPAALVQQLQPQP